MTTYQEIPTAKGYPVRFNPEAFTAEGSLDDWLRRTHASKLLREQLATLGPENLAIGALNRFYDFASDLNNRGIVRYRLEGGHPDLVHAITLPFEVPKSRPDQGLSRINIATPDSSKPIKGPNYRLAVLERIDHRSWEADRVLKGHLIGWSTDGSYPTSICIATSLQELRKVEDPNDETNPYVQDAYRTVLTALRKVVREKHL